VTKEGKDVSPDRIIHFIDDEKDMAIATASALKRHGHAVHAFSSASEALEDIETKCRGKVSMLITDVRMPVYSGFEIARRTRAIIPDVPVVFMTAFEINSIEFDKIFPSLKVNEFLQKPCQIQRLLQVVKKYEKCDI
jgi:FixJ family two-component response regulator